MPAQRSSAYNLANYFVNWTSEHHDNSSRAGAPPRQHDDDQGWLPHSYRDPFGQSRYDANPPLHANRQLPNPPPPAQDPVHAWTNFGREVGVNQDLDSSVRGANHQQSAYAGYGQGDADVSATVPSDPQNPALEPDIEEEEEAATEYSDDESNYEPNESDDEEEDEEPLNADEDAEEVQDDGEFENAGEVEDGQEVDYGNFVTPAEECKSHGEKPGEIRYEKGNLEWLDPSTQVWRLACIHHNIRRELIERAQARYPGRRYRFPTAAGPGPHDITSFHPNYEAWGTDRTNWPDILFEFDPPPKDQLNTAKPDVMMFDGMVVLNHQNNPVLDYDIPATLNSTTPGCFIEAWKRMFPMSHQDIRARMVRYTINSRGERQPLSDKNAVVNMPMQRFRDQAGCVAWLTREKKHREGLIKFFNSQGIDVVRDNSTRGLNRVLTKEEQMEVRKGDKAQFPDYNPNASKTNAPRTISNTNAFRKRSRDDEEDSLDETHGDSTKNPGTRKRVRRLSDGTIQAIPEDEAVGRPSNFLQRQLANGRVQGMGKRRSMPNGTNRVVRKPAQPSSLPSNQSVKRPEENNIKDDQTPEGNDEDSDMSGNDLEEQDQNGLTENGHDEDIDRLEPNVDQYINQYTNPSENSRDLENHRRTMRELLGEGQRVEYDESDGFGYGPYPYPPSAAPASNTQNNYGAPTSSATADPSIAQNPKKRGHSEVDDDEEIAPPGTEARKLSSNANRGNASFGQSAAQLARTIRQARNTTRRSSRSRHIPSVQGNSSRTVKTTAETAEETPANIDYRTVAPTTEYECQVLSEALSATREAYFEYTGNLAPTTHRDQSYLSQWGTIYRNFNDNFDWSQEPDGTPYIPQLSAWSTSLTDWPPHVKDSLYYRAWTHGVRAPALPNGEVINLPGEFLERIGRLGEEERERVWDDALRARGYNVDEEVYQEGEP